MPRGPRLLEEDNYYHIVTRGNDKKSLFKCDNDNMYFLNLASSYLSKHPLFILHYCLMNNHVHFLIKIIKIRSVSKFFQALLQSYAAYYRRQYDHVGFLFQNRYKSHLIDKETYLLECARYIERNPIRAGIVTSLSDYKWSSYLYYAEGRKNDIIKMPNPLYIELSANEERRRQMYKDYVSQDRPYDLLIDKGLRV